MACTAGCTCESSPAWSAPTAPQHHALATHLLTPLQHLGDTPLSLSGILSGHFPFWAAFSLSTCLNQLLWASLHRAGLLCSLVQPDVQHRQASLLPLTAVAACNPRHLVPVLPNVIPAG